MRMKSIALALALLLAPQVALSAQSKVEESSSPQLLEQSEQDLVRARQSGGVIGLGIRVDSIELEDENVAIESVEPNSPAAKAGLQEGDTVWMINNRLVDKQSIYRLLSEIWSSKEVSLVIERGDAIRQVTLRSEDFKFGFTIASTGATRYWQVDTLAKGGPGELAGLRTRDIILAVNFRSIDDLSVDEEVEDYLDQGNLGDKVMLTIRRDDETRVVAVPLGIVEAPEKSVDYFLMRADVSDTQYSTTVKVGNLDWAGAIDQLESLRWTFADRKQVTVLLEGACGNDPEIAARFIARFVPEGVILRLKEKSGSGYKEVVYSVKDGVLSRQMTDSNGTSTQEVETGILLIASAPVTSVVVDAETVGTAEAMAHALKENLNATITGGPTAGANELAQYESVGKFVVLSHNQELLTISGEEFSGVGEPPVVHVDPPELGDDAGSQPVITPEPKQGKPLTTVDKTEASSVVPLLFIVPAALILCAVLAFVFWRKRNAKGGVNLKK